jgi:hypothetical protein
LTRPDFTDEVNSLSTGWENSSTVTLLVGAVSFEVDNLLGVAAEAYSVLDVDALVGVTGFATAITFAGDFAATGNSMRVGEGIAVEAVGDKGGVDELIPMADSERVECDRFSLAAAREERVLVISISVGIET